ncbi:oxidative stress defense protein [Shewanella sp. UCD-KL12]|uniref:oxidative stress defense protein n=1 Tax=Shewanella sp. UCD-KL12 TaxID=1917163 RepID=UPI000970C8D8|nr:oxidative stress defense protein [Shewanella sp. UCD-KL12]
MNRSLIAAFISTSLMISIPFAQANELSFAHVETVGVSELAVQADMAEINVEVSVKALTAQDAKSSSDTAVAKFVSRLKKAGIAQDNIESANLNLQPQYRYEKNKPAELIGYSANRRVTVTVHELSRLNEILDSALEEGINRVNNIALKTSKETEYMNKARSAAINDAKQKAQFLAEGFDETLDGVWEIRYFDQGPIQPVMLRMNAGPSHDVAQSYQQGQVTIRDRVEVVYKLK